LFFFFFSWGRDGEGAFAFMTIIARLQKEEENAIYDVLAG